MLLASPLADWNPPMDISALAARVEAMETELTALRAESSIRKIIARYMMLCDTPLPVAVANPAERVPLIVDLFSEDAVWEGVGPYYDNQFGRRVGRAQLIEHFEGFYRPQTPELVLNCHYLTDEQIHVDGDVAEGHWVHFQPWVFSDGTSLLRSSRLNNQFKRVDGLWKMSRYRTENILIAPLPTGWVSNVPETSGVLAGSPDRREFR